MAKATETLKKSRNINISISLDAEALMRALQKEDGEEPDDGKEEEGPAVKMLKQMRDETPIVKMSQIPMAG